MKDDLLWVYEGLTSYLGDVLSARSGLRSPETYREELASIAAALDHLPGRTWRNLQDTADGVPSMQDAPPQWNSWRRGLDYLRRRCSQLALGGHHHPSANARREVHRRLLPAFLRWSQRLARR